jgi:transcription initiation factor TFIIB
MLSEAVDTARGRASCVECGGQLILDPESGEDICRTCGVVRTTWDGPMYELGNSWTQQGAEVSSNLMYDIQLHTLIGTADSNGVKTGQNHDYERLRRMNLFTITRDSKIDNGMRAMNEINRVVAVLGLSNSVAREAQEIYRKGLKSGIIRGRSIVNMSAASVLLACRLSGASCTPEEMERALTTISGKTTRRYYRLLVRDMNLKIERPSFASFVGRIAGKAGLSVRAERRALELLELAGSDPVLADKRGSSVAAAALYLAAGEVGEHTSQLKIAVAGGATPITIRKRSVELSRIVRASKGTGVSADNADDPQAE